MKGQVMTISHYQFGRMVIDSHTYTADLIIHGRKVIADWWRKEGHRIDLDDLSGVSLAEASALLVGTGYYGRITVCPALAEYCRKNNIALEAHPTGEAVNFFNNWTGDRELLVAGFHLTC